MIEIRSVMGPDVGPYLADVARLRIAVFREWPYLYEGDLDYEHGYLATYARSRESLFVLALDGTRVVGASTGVPLADEVESFRIPFRERGIPETEVFYFGESVLLPEFRGHGLGHRFFDAREASARSLGRFRWTAFCAVNRRDTDPRRPPDYRPLDSFWQARGYSRQDAMTVRLRWKEIGQGADSENQLTVWTRRLAR
jgi:GNAT superfamily N-acetyltransferase